MFLMELEMVSGFTKYPWEAFLKVSSRTTLSNLVKIPSLFLESWWTWMFLMEVEMVSR